MTDDSKAISIQTDRTTPPRSVSFDINDHEFACKDDVDVADVQVVDFIEEGQGRLIDFFAMVLKDDAELERYKSVIYNPAERVKGEHIADIYNALVEAYTGRPLWRSVLSGRGVPDTAITSEENSSSPESTPTPSPSETG